MFLHDLLWVHILQFIYGDVHFPLCIDTVTQFASTSRHFRSLVKRCLPTLPLAVTILKSTDLKSRHEVDQGRHGYTIELSLSCGRINTISFLRSISDVFLEVWPHITHAKFTSIYMNKEGQSWLASNKNVICVCFTACTFERAVPACWGHVEVFYLRRFSPYSYTVRAVYDVMMNSRCIIDVQSYNDKKFLLEWYKLGADLTRLRMKETSLFAFFIECADNGVAIPDGWNGHIRESVGGIYEFDLPL